MTALARAFHWQELIDSGRFASVTELAEALGVDRSYVGRVMRLALLAPDIVDAIVDGREPSGLSLERLVKGMAGGVGGAARRGWGFRGSSGGKELDLHLVENMAGEGKRQLLGLSDTASGNNDRRFVKLSLQDFGGLIRRPYDDRSCVDLRRA